VTTYQYDAAGRLASFTDPAGTVAYTYDQNGNVLTVSDAVYRAHHQNVRRPEPGHQLYG
jgi:YD repeat-containing protein